MALSSQYAGTLIVEKIVQVSEPPLSATLFSWLNPFDNDVWIVIGAMFLVSAAVFWLLEHDQVGGDIEGQDEWTQIMISLYLTVATFTGAGGIMYAPKSLAGRLFALSWSMWCLLTVTAYTASLASFLVVRGSNVRGISSMEHAMQQNAVICVWGNAADYEMVSTLYPEALLLKSSNHEGALLDLAAGKCAGAVLTSQSWELLQMQAEYNGNCSLTYVGRPLTNIQAGFAVKQDAYFPQCTSLIRDVLDIHFREMKHDGFIEEAWANHYRRVLGAKGPVGCANTGSRRSGDFVAGGGSKRLKGTGAGGSGGTGGTGSGSGSMLGAAVGSNPLSKRLSMRDLGGTHITYVALICISLFCLLCSTKTAEGKRLLVPWLTGIRPVTEDASTERGNLSAIRHQGLICKQGRVVRSRKWRYFVLDDHAIKYYKDRFAFERNPADFIGRFDCYGLAAHIDKERMYDRWGYTFTIEGEHEQNGGDNRCIRIMECACEVASEREAWIAQIRLASYDAAHGEGKDILDLIPRLVRSTHAAAAQSLAVEHKVEMSSARVEALSRDVTRLQSDVAQLLQLVQGLCTPSKESAAVLPMMEPEEPDTRVGAVTEAVTFDWRRSNTPSPESSFRGNPLKLKSSESVQSLVTSQFYFPEVTEAEPAESEARSGILQRTHSLPLALPE